MKKFLLPLVLSLCLLLAACGNNHTNNANNNLTENNASTNQVENNLPDTSDTPTDDGQQSDDTQEPVELGTLTVEVVVDSEDADDFLSLLRDLSALLDQKLSENGYDAEAVTVTVSTAGGTTADALAAGGVDIALLPAEDFVACENSATGILMDDGEIPTDVVAVTSDKAELDNAFQEALAAALTDGGEESFLSLCHPNMTYVSFDSGALQPIRDKLAEEQAAAHPEG